METAKPKPRVVRVKSTTVKPLTEEQKPSAVIKTVKPAAAQPAFAKFSTVDEWAKLRQKNSTKYVFTPKGDLVGPDQLVIEMISKIPANEETIQHRLEEKKAAIAEAEAKFTEARRALYQVVLNYRGGSATVGDVLEANQAVHVADCALALVSKYPRYIKEDGVYIFRDLHLDDFYNVRTIPDQVLENKYTTFPTQLFWADKVQEKITLDTVNEEAREDAQNEETKKNSARIGAIIAANRRNAMAGGH